MEELDIKIDKLKEKLDNDTRIKEIKELKKKILSNKELLSKISRLKELDKYSGEYIELKKDLFKNDEFVRFKELENEIDFLIFEINNHLKELTNERRCKDESN